MKRVGLIAFCLASCLAIQPARAVVYYDVYSTDGADTLLLGFEVDSELSFMATSPSPISDLIGTDAAAFPQATEAMNDVEEIAGKKRGQTTFSSRFLPRLWASSQETVAPVVGGFFGGAASGIGQARAAGHRHHSQRLMRGLA
jgi:hypothetical protein